MRLPFVAGNWKMYTTPATAAELASRIRHDSEDVDFADIAVFPPFVCIPAVRETLDGSNIEVGAQDLYWETEGAFTGAISAGMVAESGCVRVLIGHSERRSYFGETDEKVLKKIAGFERLPRIALPILRAVFKSPAGYSLKNGYV